MRKAKKRRWSSAHITKLRDGARKHRPARSIAKRLRRSEGAVRQKAFALRVSLDTRAGMALTA